MSTLLCIRIMPCTAQQHHHTFTLQQIFHTYAYSSQYKAGLDAHPGSVCTILPIYSNCFRRNQERRMRIWLCDRPFFVNLSVDYICTSSRHVMEFAQNVEYSAHATARPMHSVVQCMCTNARDTCIDRCPFTQYYRWVCICIDTSPP